MQTTNLSRQMSNGKSQYIERPHADFQLKTLGQRIKFFRLSAGLTRTDLAAALGYTEGRGLRTISAWETDFSEPRRRVVRQLSRIFKVDVAELEGIPLAAQTVESQSLEIKHFLSEQAPATLGERIRYFRIRAGFSQARLAIALGYAKGKGQTTIGRWERDSAEPRREKIRKLSEILRIDLAELEGVSSEHDI